MSRFFPIKQLCLSILFIKWFPFPFTQKGVESAPQGILRRRLSSRLDLCQVWCFKNCPSPRLLAPRASSRDKECQLNHLDEFLAKVLVSLRWTASPCFSRLFLTFWLKYNSRVQFQFSLTEYRPTFFHAFLWVYQRNSLVVASAFSYAKDNNDPCHGSGASTDFKHTSETFPDSACPTGSKEIRQGEFHLRMTSQNRDMISCHLCPSPNKGKFLPTINRTNGSPSLVNIYWARLLRSSADFGGPCFWMRVVPSSIADAPSEVLTI